LSFRPLFAQYVGYFFFLENRKINTRSARHIKKFFSSLMEKTINPFVNSGLRFCPPANVIKYPQSSSACKLLRGMILQRTKPPYYAKEAKNQNRCSFMRHCYGNKIRHFFPPLEFKIKIPYFRVFCKFPKNGSADLTLCHLGLRAGIQF
jgi:hypothetical protein